MHVHLARWELGTEPETRDFAQGYWHPPAPGCRGSLSLRSRAECAQRGGTGGWGVFAYDQAQPGLTVLTDDPHGALSQAVRDEMAATFGIVSGETRFDELVWDYLARRGDPTHQARWRGLWPGRDRRMPIWLAGELVKTDRVEVGSQEWAHVLANAHASYRKLKARDLHRQYLSVQMEKYRTGNFELFIPEGEPVVEPLPHATTLSDDFSGATNWTSIFGAFTDANADLRSTGADPGDHRHARYDDPVSTGDHFAKTDFTIASVTSRLWGTSGRVHATTFNLYTAWMRALSGLYNISSYVDGVGTSIGNDNGNGQGPTVEVKIECDGTTISAFKAGAATPDIQVTDTDHDDTQHHLGFYAYQATTAGGDNFAAEDLAAVPIAAALALGAEAGLSPAMLAQMAGAAPLGADAAAVHAALAQMSGASSYAASGGLTGAALAQTIGAVALAAEAAETVAALARMAADAGLGAAAGVVPAALAQMAAALPLDAEAALAADRGLQFAADFTLAASADLAGAARMTFDGPLGLAADVGLIGAGTALMEGSLALGAAAGVEPAGLASLAGAIAQAVSAGVSVDLAVVIEAAAGLDAAAGAGVSAEAAMAAQLAAAIEAVAAAVGRAATAAGLAMTAEAALAPDGAVVDFALAAGANRTFKVAARIDMIVPARDPMKAH